MRKQKRGMLLGGILAMVLLLAACLLHRSAKEAADVLSAAGDTGETQQEKTQLWETEPSRMQSLRLEKEKEVCEIVQTESGLTMEDFPAEKLNRDLLEEAVSQLFGTYLEENLGEQEDLEQFGLSREAVCICMEDRDGTERRVLVGNRLPDRTDAYYILDAKEVWVAGGLPQTLLEGRRAFYKTELVEIPARAGENGMTEDRLQELRLSGSRFPDEIHIVENAETNSGYLMDAPVFSEAMFAETEQQTGYVSVLACLAQITADGVAVENAGSEALREYGLEEPEACAEYVLNGEKHRVRVGTAGNNGMRPIMVDEDPNIYLVRKERVASWAEADVMELRPSYIWLVDVGQLQTLTISRGEEVIPFELKWTADETGEKTLLVGWENREWNAQEEWLLFYQKLIGMTVMNVNRPDAWEEQAAYRVTYAFREETGKEPVTVSFHREAKGNRYVALLNGNFAGVLRPNTVEEISGLLDGMIADEKNR